MFLDCEPEVSRVNFGLLVITVTVSTGVDIEKGGSLWDEIFVFD